MPPKPASRRHAGVAAELLDESMSTQDAVKLSVLPKTSCLASRTNLSLFVTGPSLPVTCRLSLRSGAFPPRQLLCRLLSEKNRPSPGIVPEAPIPYVSTIHSRFYT
ncbi:hypothetical protein VTN96DRAFT_477 [Rasamsonia emersonii]